MCSTKRQQEVMATTKCHYLRILFIILSTSRCGNFQVIKYVDQTVEDHDFMFDRMCSISDDTAPLEDGYYPLIVTGVLISSYQILTTLNPLRRIQFEEESVRDNIYVACITQRERDENGTWFYAFNTSRIDCGRPVVYVDDDELEVTQWHGIEKINSPVHDLFVLRLATEQLVANKEIKEEYNMGLFPLGKHTVITPGPFVTELAKPGDRMGRSFKFASAGYKNMEDITTWRRLRKTEYTERELVDCDDWIPKNWGTFICILNIHNYPALGSGAMLFSKNKLFGVGSFAMFKNHASVFVFTDVRPYYDNIMFACTLKDFEE